MLQVPSDHTKPRQVHGCSRSHLVSPRPPGPSGPWVLQIPSGLTRSHQVSPNPSGLWELQVSGPVRLHQILLATWVFQFPPSHQVPPDPTSSHQVLGCSRSHQVSPNPLGFWVLQIPGLIRSHQVPSAPWMLQIPPDLTRSSRSLRAPGPTVLHVTGFPSSHSSRQ